MEVNTQKDSIKGLNVNNIIGQMQQYGFIQSVQRFKYLPYKMNVALNIVQQIGKSMNPAFVIDDDNRFVYENMIRWIQGDAEMKCIDPVTRKIVPGDLSAGIYIAGPTGTGKSFVLNLFSVYCKIDDVQIGINNDPSKRCCLSWAMSSYRSDEICEEYNKEGTFNRFKKMTVLAIQDIGSEPTESMYMGNRVNVIRQILESRGDRNDMITLMSSNHSIEKIGAKYGDRVASRLHQMTNYFELKGKDRRC